ncbi:MAG: SusC/RagA family TonB-linked outer membrane protein, partial [Cyclobacteriaceae bacterium]|nr:SusC/RagA family TonB-linked outer membrane protein [Cyclobacteriaceae bacterium]
MLRYVLSAVICILSVFSLRAQDREVSGRVIARSDSMGLPGVNVVIKGTAIGTATDLEGYYSMPVPDVDSLVLVYTYVGYARQEVFVGGRSQINIILVQDFTELQEVIVTGYKSETKADIIGSITSVSAKDFEDMPVVGIDQALQGQAPGVQVTQSSGTPGGGISVRVRGSTSISASNRPLFIVDGVPVEDGALAMRSFGGQEDNALSTLNPNDIESIQILKDAAAKAIYGSRAANGVVLVTTKRGTSGETTFDFDVQRGIIDITKKVDMLNASQLLELQREAVRNAGLNPDARGLIPDVTDAVDTDWLDEILRTGILQQYQMSVRGGTKQTRMYLSGSYREEEGVQLNNKFERLSGTLNIDHEVSQRMNFGTNLILARTWNDRVKGDNFLDGVYSGAIKSLPYYSPFNEQGQLVGPGSPTYAAFPNFNPVLQAVIPRFETHTTKVLGGAFVNYSFMENLTLHSKASIDYNSLIEDQFEPSTTAIGGFLPSVGGSGYGVYSTGVYATLLQSNVVTWNDSFGKHNVSALGGTEVIHRKVRSSSVEGRLFPSD